MIAEATGATEEAAIAALHEVIDSRENRRIDNRRRNPKTGLAVPSTEEYVEAMRQVVLSEPQRAMLTALSLSGEDGLTDARMAYAAGYKTRTSANRSFIAAGNLIGEYLSLDTGTNEISGDPEGAAHLGYRNEPGNEGDQGHWILYAEVREAVRLAL
ncbi:hypothetical protein SAMN05421849_0236 [Pontibaca methylaminivorans]|uniref:Uncharacterized protein n=2 Tax=Pontibaca methylaminivorans TaxID=515897 RepID=A0A1R3WCY9_9RHOB|nr:hypothetical protein SAMN05421849_0236 [Pontibaca methylaminivorans]